MDDRKKAEEWADAFLDEHRTAPRAEDETPPRHPPERHPLEDTPLVRLATKMSGQRPDPAMLDRVSRLDKHRARFANLEAIATLILVLLGCALVFVVSSGF